MNTFLRQYRKLPMHQKASLWGVAATMVGAVLALLTVFMPQEVRSQQNEIRQVVTQERGANIVGSDNVVAHGNLSAEQLAAARALAPRNTEAQPKQKPPAAQTPVYIHQETRAPNSNNVIGDRNVIVDTVNIRPGYSPDYPEPTAAEMKGALLRAMVLQGARAAGDDGVEVNRLLAGARIEIAQFSKLGCAPALGSAGYVCDYLVNTKLRLYSNEGSAAGDRHADAVNQLMGFMLAGREASIAKGRFMNSENGWMFSPEA
jgi:hypothetical protein